MTDIIAKRKSEACVKQEISLLLVGRDNVVGIASRYGLDGKGIETRWGRDFLHPPTQNPIQWIPRLYRL
jgi:hypothetical protein